MICSTLSSILLTIVDNWLPIYLLRFGKNSINYFTKEEKHWVDCWNYSCRWDFELYTYMCSFLRETENIESQRGDRYNIISSKCSCIYDIFENWISSLFENEGKWISLLFPGCYFLVSRWNIPAWFIPLYANLWYLLHPYYNS